MARRTYRYRRFWDLMGMILWPFGVFTGVVLPEKHPPSQLIEFFPWVALYVLPIASTLAWGKSSSQFIFAKVELTSDRLDVTDMLGRKKSIARSEVLDIRPSTKPNGLRIYGNGVQVVVENSIKGYKKLRPMLLEFCGCDPSSDLRVFRSERYPTFERWWNAIVAKYAAWRLARTASPTVVSAPQRNRAPVKRRPTGD